MKVLKFGGTSVANAENIKKVSKIVSDETSEHVAVVVSALGGVTDLLLQALELASIKDISYEKTLEKIEDRHITTTKELFPIQEQSAILSHIKSSLNELETLIQWAYLIGEHTPKLSDKVVSYGELLSAHIIGKYFTSLGLNASYKSGRELVVTDEYHGYANLNFTLTNTNIKKYFTHLNNTITVIPGFVAASTGGASTTLGRGGSDYTAAIIAAAIQANELQIWTDVSGMYTANPKLVKQARCISTISYEEAMELSHFGA